MTNKLADLLFDPNNTQPIEYWYKKFPRRTLPENAEVVRLCPSPTGFLHLGALYLGVVNRRIADDTKGVFILRIEDTDTKREVAGARELIVNGLHRFGIKFDEGFIDGNTQFGDYGPYLQTERVDIYKSFARHMVSEGLVYPCFTTSEELEEQRKKQEEAKVRPGYYGEYALWRNASYEDIETEFEKGKPYVLRFRSYGNQNVKRPFRDEFFGDIEVPQNDEDFVLLKANGIPTYHFAHIIDDYLMGTTFVIRANEWLPSVGKHLELWDAMKLPVPKYGHIMPINKQEGNAVRKLSKRKDPEADIMRYIELGYPTQALVGYLFRLANPSFDDWWQSEKRASVFDFPFSLDEFSQSGRGPLIDLKKLDSISSDVISMMSTEEITEQFLSWAKEYDMSFFDIISKDIAYLQNILAIERNIENPRKDIINWSTGRDVISYFFDELFDLNSVNTMVENSPMEEILSKISSKLVEQMSEITLYQNISLEEWVSKMKTISETLGFATNKNDLKENPTKYHGDFSMFMKLIRISITGRDYTPNLFYIFSVMGKDRIISRLTKPIN